MECTVVTTSHSAQHIRLLVFGGLFVFGAAAPAAGGPDRGSSVKLWPGAIVIENVVRLGDVAELRGFDLDTEASLKDLALIPAPEPGGSRIIALPAIREALADSGVNRARVYVKGAAECAVRRPTQAPRPTPEVKTAPSSAPNGDVRSACRRTLRDAVITYFDQQLASYGGRADLGFGRTSAQVLDLSAGEFNFRVRRKSSSVMGLTHVDVTIVSASDGAEVQRVPMVVDVALVRDVVVAGRAINRGASVGADDVRVVSRRFTRPDRMGMPDPGEVIGLRARRFIAPGELIAARDLERVPLVRRGQIVEVLSRFGTVTVNTAAKVSEDGDYGELVTLHMPGRRKVRIVGRVTGPRRVEVGEWDTPDPNGTALADGGRR